MRLLPGAALGRSGSSGLASLAAHGSFNGRGRNWPRCRVRCVGGAGPLSRSSMAAGTAAALAFLNQESRARAGAVGGPRVPAPVTMDSFFFGIEDGGGRGWHGADETVG